MWVQRWHCYNGAKTSIYSCIFPDHSRLVQQGTGSLHQGPGRRGQWSSPWIGHANEAKIKEEILGLSQDRRNFVRAPPAGVDFEFSYDTAYPTAIAIMAEDKALETMRFELVPKM